MEISEITRLAVPAVDWTLVTIGSCDNNCASTLWDPCAADLLGFLGDTERPVTTDEMTSRLRHSFPAIAVLGASLQSNGGESLRGSQQNFFGNGKTHRDVLC